MMVATRLVSGRDDDVTIEASFRHAGTSGPDPERRQQT
jgi:hypothetical protein